MLERTMKVFVKIAFVLALMLFPAYIYNADLPSSFALLHQSDLVYQGAFRLPKGSFGSTSGIGFEYGGHPVTYNPANNTLFISGYDILTAEVSIPTPVAGNKLGSLNTAVVIHNFVDAYEGKRKQVDPTEVNGIAIGGGLFYENSFYMSVFDFYDAEANQATSHFIRPQSLAASGQVQGPFKVGALNPGFYSGYMGLIPVEWRSAFGGPAITGNCCLPIITRTSLGPAAFVFNPVHLGVVNPVPAKPLVYYPSEHPTLGTYSASPEIPNLYYNGMSEVKGVVFPSQTRSVLFFGRQGTGKFCYGTGGAGNGECYDPVSGDKGGHAYPYIYYVWVYDALELLKVKNDQKKPWDVIPYEMWTLSFPFGLADARILGADYDAQTNRIFITQWLGEESLPIVYVYTVNAGNPNAPATPTKLRIY
jgi:hypothetical protein